MGYWEWEEQLNGNWVNIDGAGSLRATVFFKNGGWRWVVYGYFAKADYDTAETAMRGAEGFVPRGGTMAGPSSTSSSPAAPASKWKRSTRGNLYRRTSAGVVVIYRHRQRWVVFREHWFLRCRVDGQIVDGLPTEDEARVWAEESIARSVPEIRSSAERRSSDSCWWELPAEPEPQTYDCPNTKPKVKS